MTDFSLVTRLAFCPTPSGAFKVLKIQQTGRLKEEEDENVQIMLTCIRSWQVELRPGVPWSAAITVKAYSARSAHLRGEAVLSSPLFGWREKRSALGPEYVEIKGYQWTAL